MSICKYLLHATWEDGRQYTILNAHNLVLDNGMAEMMKSAMLDETEKKQAVAFLQRKGWTEIGVEAMLPESEFWDPNPMLLVMFPAEVFGPRRICQILQITPTFYLLATVEESRTEQCQKN